MRYNQRYGALTLLIPLMALVYAVILSACFHDAETSVTRVVPDGDPQRGRQAIQQYGCGGCHMIPGVDGADSMVGPPLTDWANRIYIAGRLPNTPENLTRWIQNPQAIDPENVMPNLGVSEEEAQDIAAYLYTLGR